MAPRIEQALADFLSLDQYKQDFVLDLEHEGIDSPILDAVPDEYKNEGKISLPHFLRARKLNADARFFATDFVQSALKENKKILKHVVALAQIYSLFFGDRKPAGSFELPFLSLDEIVQSLGRISQSIPQALEIKNILDELEIPPENQKILFHYFAHRGGLPQALKGIRKFREFSAEDPRYTENIDKLLQNRLSLASAGTWYEVKGLQVFEEEALALLDQLRGQIQMIHLAFLLLRDESLDYDFKDFGLKVQLLSSLGTPKTVAVKLLVETVYGHARVEHLKIVVDWVNSLQANESRKARLVSQLMKTEAYRSISGLKALTDDLRRELQDQEIAQLFNYQIHYFPWGQSVDFVNLFKVYLLFKANSYSLDQSLSLAREVMKQNPNFSNPERQGWRWVARIIQSLNLLGISQDKKYDLAFQFLGQLHDADQIVQLETMIHHFRKLGVQDKDFAEQWLQTDFNNIRLNDIEMAYELVHELIPQMCGQKYLEAVFDFAVIYSLRRDELKHYSPSWFKQSFDFEALSRDFCEQDLLYLFAWAIDHQESFNPKNQDSEKNKEHLIQMAKFLRDQDIHRFYRYSWEDVAALQKPYQANQPTLTAIWADYDGNGALELDKGLLARAAQARFNVSVLEVKNDHWSEKTRSLKYKSDFMIISAHGLEGATYLGAQEVPEQKIDQYDSEVGEALLAILKQGAKIYFNSCLSAVDSTSGPSAAALASRWTAKASVQVYGASCFVNGKFNFVEGDIKLKYYCIYENQYQAPILFENGEKKEQAKLSDAWKVEKFIEPWTPSPWSLSQDPRYYQWLSEGLETSEKQSAQAFYEALVAVEEAQARIDKTLRTWEDQYYYLDQENILKSFLEYGYGERALAKKQLETSNQDLEKTIQAIDATLTKIDLAVKAKFSEEPLHQPAREYLVEHRKRFLRARENLTTEIVFDQQRVQEEFALL